MVTRSLNYYGLNGYKHWRNACNNHYKKFEGGAAARENPPEEFRLPHREGEWNLLCDFFESESFQVSVRVVNGIFTLKTMLFVCFILAYFDNLSFMMQKKSSVGSQNRSCRKDDHHGGSIGFQEHAERAVSYVLI